jgi:hypothetical protein
LFPWKFINYRQHPELLMELRSRIPAEQRAA